jgi:hypothetical protein
MLRYPVSGVDQTQESGREGGTVGPFGVAEEGLQLRIETVQVYVGRMCRFWSRQHRAQGIESGVQMSAVIASDTK